MSQNPGDKTIIRSVMALGVSLAKQGQLFSQFPVLGEHGARSLVCASPEIIEQGLRRRAFRRKHVLSHEFFVSASLDWVLATKT